MDKYKISFYREIYKLTRYRYIKGILKEFRQHGDTSVWEHSRNVAYKCYVIAKIIEKNYDVKFNYDELIVGAYLHDFFLYDWHEKADWHKWHGFKHPMIAANNADRMFGITDKERLIIESHMWPLNITKLPKSKEAILVCLVDKIETLKEIAKKVENEIFEIYF